MSKEPIKIHVVLLYEIHVEMSIRLIATFEDFNIMSKDGRQSSDGLDRVRVGLYVGFGLCRI